MSPLKPDHLLRRDDCTHRSVNLGSGDRQAQLITTGTGLFRVVHASAHTHKKKKLVSADICA